MFRYTDDIMKKRYSAYTLAETLIVMAIIAIVIVSLPGATKKLFKLDTIRSSHGRFECYWKTENGNKTLWQYQVMETGDGKVSTIANGPAPGGEVCEFTPPDTYPYMILHAVGGGGSGVDVAANPAGENQDMDIVYKDNVPAPEERLKNISYHTAISYLYSNARELWPDWIKYTKRSDYSAFNKNYWEATAVFKRRILKYGPSGTSGKLKSLFTPKLPQNTFALVLRPGQGGSLGSPDNDGNNGNPSYINIAYSKAGRDTCRGYTGNGCSGDCCNMVVAEGGKGGTISFREGAVNVRKVPTTAVQLAGGAPGDYGVSEYSSVKTKTSQFLNALSNDSTDANLNSQIQVANVNEPGPGDGGRGANHFVNNTAGLAIYEINQYGTVKTTGRVENSYWRTVEVPKGAYSQVNNCELVNMSNYRNALSDIRVKRIGYCHNQGSYSGRNARHCALGDIRWSDNKDYKINIWGYWGFFDNWNLKKPAIDVIVVMKMNSTKDVDYIEPAYPSGINSGVKGQVYGLFTKDSTKPFSKDNNTCTYNSSENTIECMQRINVDSSDNANAKIHWCTQQTGNSKCSNGATPVNGKCQAQRGGDGAIVILW